MTIINSSSEDAPSSDIEPSAINPGSNNGTSDEVNTMRSTSRIQRFEISNQDPKFFSKQVIQNSGTRYKAAIDPRHDKLPYRTIDQASSQDLDSQDLDSQDLDSQDLDSQDPRTRFSKTTPRQPQGTLHRQSNVNGRTNSQASSIAKQMSPSIKYNQLESRTPISNNMPNTARNMNPTNYRSNSLYSLGINSFKSPAAHSSPLKVHSQAASRFRNANLSSDQRTQQGSPKPMKRLRSYLSYASAASNYLNPEANHRTYNINENGLPKPTNNSRGNNKYSNEARNYQNKIPVAGKSLGKKIDLSQYRQVSLKHLVHDVSKSNIKKLCIGGSDKKIGCDWTQFNGYHYDALETISKNLEGKYYVVQDDFRAKTTYYIFDEIEEANQLMAAKMTYFGEEIEFYQTVKYDEDVTIINIPNFRDVGIKSIIKLIKKELEAYGTIKDISAWSKKGRFEFLPSKMMVLFIKNDIRAEIPNFLEHENGKICMFYKGCQQICSYCKKSGHWKSECPELKNKISEKNLRKLGTKSNAEKHSTPNVNTNDNLRENIFLDDTNCVNLGSKPANLGRTEDILRQSNAAYMEELAKIQTSRQNTTLNFKNSTPNSKFNYEKQGMLPKDLNSPSQNTNDESKLKESSKKGSVIESIKKAPQWELGNQKPGESNLDWADDMEEDYEASMDDGYDLTSSTDMLSSDPIDIEGTSDPEDTKTPNSTQ
ncbi:hypothetical protein AYI69_g8230 [Smittium culicis]|uniref:CCHC-type domain-containing protein n=1 Tax=Smittium culicis TaxID=133412 RepID=A0A1R1XL17_9FUNG|nr:hypothetical protein AYI69_g8230 [Smittium culicis]